jgi:hypothetical protein
MRFSAEDIESLGASLAGKLSRHQNGEHASERDADCLLCGGPMIPNADYWRRIQGLFAGLSIEQAGDMMSQALAIMSLLWSRAPHDPFEGAVAKWEQAMGRSVGPKEG